VPLYLALFAVSNFAGPLVLGRLFDTVGRKPMIAGTYIGSAIVLREVAVTAFRTYPSRSFLPSTIRSASSSRPWMNSQRGLSGTWRRTIRMPMPSTAPKPKAIRQPTSSGKVEVSSTSAPSAPSALPSQ